VTEEISVHSLAVARRYLVYGLHLEGNEDDIWSVCRLNVATGRLETIDRRGGFSRLQGGVLSTVVNPSGALGWMTAGEYVFPPQGERFVSADRKVFVLAAGSRTPQLLASSPAVEAASLAASENRLYWTEGGMARQAPF